MAYTKPAATTLAGLALKQTPTPTANAITPVVLDAEVASTTQLGVVKIGSGITVDPSGTISAAADCCPEVGNWTPALLPSVPGVIFLNTKTARYVKSGNLVTCTFDVAVTSITGGSNASTLKLSGLPYSSESSTGYVGVVLIGYFSDMNTNTNYISGSVISTSTQGDLWFQKEADKSLTKLTQANVKTNTRLVGTVQYLSAT
jgi:hypothetical protein